MKLSNTRLAAKARQLVRHPARVPAADELEAFSRAWTETAAYASRLAGAPGELIYEDMFKLMCLLDDLESLAKAGAAVDDATKELVRRDVSERIVKQRRMAAMTAEDLVDDENANVWPFAELAKRATKERRKSDDE